MTPSEVDVIVDKKLEPILEKLDRITKFLDKFEGASILLKALILGVVPLVAGYSWLKEHFKL